MNTNPDTLDLLNDVDAYLCALHVHAARHDQIGADFTCGGCLLRDRIAAALPALAAASVPPPADRDTLRDRIRRAVCEAEGFAWDPDMLEPDEYGDVADAVLAVLPEPTDRAAVLREAADHLATLRPCDDCDPGRHDAIERLRRLAAEASTTKSEVEPCAHCGKTIRLVTGTLAQWWVHEPGGHTICFPEQAASSPRATPRPAAGVRQDGAQP